MVRVVLLLLVGLSAWAQELEVFTLKDGRVIVGSYDQASKRMEARVGGGVVGLTIEPAMITKRVPYVPPPHAVPPAKTETAPEPVPVAEAPQPPKKAREWFIQEKARIQKKRSDESRAAWSAFGVKNPEAKNLRNYMDRLAVLKKQCEDLRLEARIEPDPERKQRLIAATDEAAQRHDNLVDIINPIIAARKAVYEVDEFLQAEEKKALQSLTDEWREAGYGPRPIP